MDVRITQTETCACGRSVIGVSGVCDTCIHDGARVFWAFMAGTVTFGQFMIAITDR